MGAKYQYYLIRIQFLGFRYSGWQKQPNQKTIEGMILKTLKFILPDRKLKILGAGRTDAKVSALEGSFELFLEGNPIIDKESFVNRFNLNLPPDIKVVDIVEKNKNFNVIKNVRQKEYVYFFSFGTKNHPFSAPFIVNVQSDLDIELMKKACELFIGDHDFSAYTVKEGKSKNNLRRINSCSISENDILKANFFPKTSYAFRIEGKGFMRYQVRLMMGALIQLGKGELKLSDIETSLKPNGTIELSYVAPGSGLLLHKLYFDDEQRHQSKSVEER